MNLYQSKSVGLLQFIIHGTCTCNMRHNSGMPFCGQYIDSIDLSNILTSYAESCQNFKFDWSPFTPNARINAHVCLLTVLALSSPSDYPVQWTVSGWHPWVVWRAWPLPPPHSHTRSGALAATSAPATVAPTSRSPPSTPRMTQTGRRLQSGLILGLRPANERRRYFVTASLIGWGQA